MRIPRHSGGFAAVIEVETHHFPAATRDTNRPDSTGVADNVDMRLAARLGAGPDMHAVVGHVDAAASNHL